MAYFELDRGGDYIKIEKCTKESFVVIGKEGTTNDGTGFI